MRLKKSEIESIKTTIKRFDKRAQIFLFGSRVDDAKKGGDIDILIISRKIKLSEKLKIEAKLDSLLGEQKIDLIATSELNTAFLRYIHERSVPL